MTDSEWLNRKKRIDPRLTSWGWSIVKYDGDKPISSYDRCAVEEWPTEDGPADYALIVGGRILDIVEAKKLTPGPQNVLTQAELSTSRTVRCASRQAHTSRR